MSFGAFTVQNSILLVCYGLWMRALHWLTLLNSNRLPKAVCENLIKSSMTKTSVCLSYGLLPEF